MTERFQCGDDAALVSYLYDECDPTDRVRIAAHISLCVACEAELAALRSTRGHLASWAPPEAELGFRIVIAGESAVPPRSSAGEDPDALHGAPAKTLVPSGAWWQEPLPAWAQAVAACVLFAGGLWLGVPRGTAPVEIAPLTGSPAPGGVASRAELDALERRIGDEMREIRTATATAMADTPPGISEAQMLVRVRAMLNQSEQRQQRELALRTAQVVRDLDAQREVDLAQIQRNIRQIDGITGAEVREQRQMLNYLMRVSEQR
ncbi:MAG: hypothetical protein O2930_04235 [Acidobacteria bacterium]|nr:hypothetical protein [Acidobacteriota bacterium]